jgi:hypothetical protein
MKTDISNRFNPPSFGSETFDQAIRDDHGAYRSLPEKRRRRVRPDHW